MAWGAPEPIPVPISLPLSPAQAQALQHIFSPVDDRAVVEAVKRAFAPCGLNVDAFDMDFDVVKTGKLHQLLHYASQNLGIDHNLHTVRDIVHFLSRA